jgi:hypothetical protein
VVLRSSSKPYSSSIGSAVQLTEIVLSVRLESLPASAKSSSGAISSASCKRTAPTAPLLGSSMKRPPVDPSRVL